MMAHEEIDFSRATMVLALALSALIMSLAVYGLWKLCFG